MKNANIMKNAWQMRRDTAAVRNTNMMNIPWSDVYHVARQHYLDSLHRKAIHQVVTNTIIGAIIILNATTIGMLIGLVATKIL